MDVLSSPANLDEPIVLAKVVGVYGIKGWVKLKTFTDDPKGVLDYQDLLLGPNWVPVKWLDKQLSSKGLRVKLDCCVDRNQAEAIVGREIAVSASRLPKLADGDFYWRDLIGLRVEDTQGQLFGKVSGLIETGANDVLDVRPTPQSLDKKSRLIPYLPGQFVIQVDLQQGLIVVDWDADF